MLHLITFSLTNQTLLSECVFKTFLIVYVTVQHQVHVKRWCYNYIYVLLGERAFSALSSHPQQSTGIWMPCVPSRNYFTTQSMFARHSPHPMQWKKQKGPSAL